MSGAKSSRSRILGHPCPSEPELAGEVGTVAVFATVYGGLPVGEREHAGDPGGAADGPTWGRWGLPR